MAGNKVVTFRTQFDGNEQTVPAVDNKGEVTITMPATAKPGEKFVLAAQAKDADNRTIGRADGLGQVDHGGGRPVVGVADGTHGSRTIRRRRRVADRRKYCRCNCNVLQL